MEKKGAIELQFNWILVLVAGAVLLIIFIGFISRQQEASSTSDDILTASSLDTIFHIYSDADVSDTIKISKSKISFNCDSFAVNSISKQLGGLSLFSPASLDTNKLQVMSLGWYVPYKITNFVYSTSPDARYIFIGESDFARKMFDKIKGKVRADGFTNTQVIYNENNDKVRLILFGQNPEMPINLKEPDLSLSAVKIDGDENKGVIEFFDFIDNKFEPRGKSYYIGEASLLGAVFADNIGIYSCNMEKGFNKMRILSNIYNKKIGHIIAHYNTAEGNNACRDFYQSNLLEILDYISYLASLDFQSSNYESIINAVNKIEEMNNDANALSCVLIY